MAAAELPLVLVDGQTLPFPGGGLALQLPPTERILRIVRSSLNLGGLLVLPEGAGRTAGLVEIQSIHPRGGVLSFGVTPRHRVRLLGEPSGTTCLQAYRLMVDPSQAELSERALQDLALIRKLAPRFDRDLPAHLSPAVVVDDLMAGDDWRDVDRLRVFRTRSLERRLALVAALVVAELPNRPAQRTRSNWGRQRRAPRARPAGDRVEKLLRRIASSGVPEDLMPQVGRRLQGAVSHRDELLDFLDAFPWESGALPVMDPGRVREVLDAEHVAAAADIKMAVARFAGVWARGMELQKPHRAMGLLLSGPPGVGKTRLAKAIARALGVTYTEISLGGISDAHTLRGSHSLYYRSQPGLLATSLRDAGPGALDGVVCLDEIGRMGASVSNGSPEAVLLPLLDSEVYTDNYLQVPIPVRRILWIATTNDLSPLSSALLDRFRILSIPAYTEKQRVEIARRALLPRLIEQLPLLEGEVEVPPETIRLLARAYTNEPGVRQLQRILEDLLSAAIVELQWNRRVQEMGLGDARALPLQIGPDDVKRWLG